ncbi:preprotein translocase subunit SecG [Sodalis endosymbiont of Henestaris halophilus]|uniref:preprotein translocase subunit SecG n=1 Tax=Sodalis endosymbiont of Henestaris halophilus TaxID=1929246 RepID=UPI000BC0B2DE|nr:preprotein translocase subunit SecG [Sodalis endosymbiont of Henestaris halophilus]SNC58708.1 Protein-export membrane protein SecG [Sodalis endosymbiont of Henestaris halophilus]
MYQILLIIFLLVAVGLVSIIMLQQGKGSDIGGGLGASASNTLFGSGGSNNFMTRMTGAVLAPLFFVLSLLLGNLSSNYVHKSNQWDNLTQTQPSSNARDEGLAKLSDDIPH